MPMRDIPPESGKPRKRTWVSRAYDRSPAPVELMPISEDAPPTVLKRYRAVGGREHGEAFVLQAAAHQAAQALLAVEQDRVIITASIPAPRSASWRPAPSA